MLGDTEAMTRTTDIAHFYKVTTEPDPEWGSGLSAPELGKLLEGAYITSTDKTISFVVGGVGKTKYKTAWANRHCKGMGEGARPALALCALSPLAA